MVKQKDGGTTEPFSGRYAEMFDAKEWLSFTDLADIDPVQVEIESINREVNRVFQDGRREKLKFSLSFVGAKKKMILNNINAKTLHKMFGQPSNWIGKKVTLYGEPEVVFAGEKTGGIRIKHER